MTMKKLIRPVLFVALLCLNLFAFATDSTIVRFDINTVRINDTENMLSIKATVAQGVKLYGLQQSAADQLYSSISFDSSFAKYLNGTIEEKGIKNIEKDASIGADVSYYSDSVLWRQKIKINSTDSLLLKGNINYFYKKGAVITAPFCN